VKSPSRAESAVATDLARFSFGRIDWAALLKHVYDVDALACPCGGRLRFIALLERDIAQSILRSLGRESAPPPFARARSPDLRDPIPTEDCLSLRRFLRAARPNQIWPPAPAQHSRR
jgi:hypothetical protein